MLKAATYIFSIMKGKVVDSDQLTVQLERFFKHKHDGRHE